MSHQLAHQPHGSAPRRRRSASVEPLTKMTFQLRASIAQAVRNVVQAGEAPSANVFVEDAIREKLRKRRRERVYAAYAEAARDPEFVADMNATAAAFDHTLADGSSAG